MQDTVVAKRLKDIWDDWGIRLLVIVSCGMHMVLTLFGSTRRRLKARQIIVRFMIWCAYPLSTFVVAVIIGKLTLIGATDSTQQNTETELRGFLAPLLLVQLGSRDSITAYSIEDNRLVIRQLPNLLAQLSAVLWILFKSWTNSVISYLYFPLSLAGIITYGENIWAMYTALNGSSGITIAEFKQEASISKIYEKLPTNIPNLEMILKAYYRFFCLRPHIENWLYRPLYQTLHDSQSIDGYEPLEIFKITDIELSFMYDVLYTKAPIIYTRMGFVFRLVTFLSLVSATIVFACFFKDAFVYYINAGFTFLVLVVILILEVYQIYMLFFSDWAIIKMIKHRNKPVVMQFLRIIAPRSSKWKRWSNSLGQFNLIYYCLDHKHLCFSRILKFQNLDTDIRKYLCTASQEIQIDLKEMLIKEMGEVDKVRRSKHTDKRGEWALSRYPDGDIFKWSVVDRDFDKSIIIWHLAIEICYHSDVRDQDSNPGIKMGRLLSNYMMYLLAIRSHMLCVTTSEIVFQYACKKLTAFLKTSDSLTKDVRTACTELQARNVVDEESEAAEDKETMVTRGWNVLGDAKMLSEYLLKRGGDRWVMICSVLVEMLCFVASKCPADYHSEQLRRGGEIVTHIWLLQLHKTGGGGSVGD
ncbi:hypothetical protein FEM48_Zijuj01G0164600 [Ziziphus jujuba var. spinosa]|uniref:DUF4220 domain-containing protein n=1 Tax=Ziziphus jujuba var. spinosa TaxID=714518 RepID=A0A978W2B4_ZIZJJ|nr:hypothetical protein FEM48_Zijuj01G0164600 [Ziziphus jujuba var. spinosa]